MKKDGKFTITQILSVILAVAGVVLIIFLMVAVLTPLFHRGEETSESYMEAFVAAIAEADDVGFADFSMWQPQDTDDREAKREYFLIYFGGQSQYSEGANEFFTSGIQRNYACICLVEGPDSQCNDCVSLKFPAKIGNNSDGWSIARGEKVRIIKEPAKDYYDLGVTGKGAVIAGKIDDDLKKILATEINFRGRVMSVDRAVGAVLEGYSNLEDERSTNNYLDNNRGTGIIAGGGSYMDIYDNKKESALHAEAKEVSAKLKVILDQYCGQYDIITPLGYVTENGIGSALPGLTNRLARYKSNPGSSGASTFISWKYGNRRFSVDYRRLASCDNNGMPNVKTSGWNEGRGI